MRSLFIGLVAFLAVPAFAQTVTAPINQPTAPVVAAPTAPSMDVPVNAPAATGNPMQNDMMQQLQKVMGKKNSPEKMGQVVAIGALLGCTQKTAGKDATNAFYQQMQTVGKTVDGYCKQGHATEARALLLSTVQQHKDNAVVKSALGCYDTQTASLTAMAGPKAAADAAKYARWMRDPAAAEQELRETDVCRNKTASLTK